MRVIVQATLLASLLMWILLGFPAWSFRDGMRPGWVESEGWDAVENFLLNFYWGPGLVVLLGTNWPAFCRRHLAGVEERVERPSAG